MLRFVGALLLPLLVLCDVRFPFDCDEIHSHGEKLSQVYTIFPNGIGFPVNVYCDMGCQNHKEDGEGWTVFQRRQDGTVNFYRPWQEYKEGFGNPSGEYWLGLENLHILTSKKNYELRVDMEDSHGNRAAAQYSSFSVGPPEDGYRLTVGGFNNGSAGDSLSGHNGMKFTTYDRDHDHWYDNCARQHLGAHWYNRCVHYSNPNGVYAWSGTKYYAIAVTWRTFKISRYSMRFFSMKIRPVA
ncbi:microfibril-associated glycoprotein 4-like [Engraulis encrasicolus]|uniref:microfibril-associated glycoprotein 4-like n=1 Tax=Engraulis encrasicolus TaxID=184585 RepID=UPI002FCEE405